mmetsp:Transcript_9044/g.20106  ORF Transcript_9044/g.20106 Transcript_9044/m.20106 type:complete len:118 (+) Transcript_9044:605-958(+)
MWGLHVGLLGALCFYVWHRTPLTRGDCKTSAAKWGPSVMLVMGSIMVMFDLTRHVILDQGFLPVLAMFAPDGSLTPVGVLGVVLTWTGFAFVILSMAWYAGYPEWLAEKWLSMQSRT